LEEDVRKHVAMRARVHETLLNPRLFGERPSWVRSLHEVRTSANDVDDLHGADRMHGSSYPPGTKPYISLRFEPVGHALRLFACVVAIWLLVTPLAKPGRPLQAPSRPLQTSLWEVPDELGVKRTVATGATVSLMVLNWRTVAPETRPTGFRSFDHEDPAYRWKSFDDRLRRVVEAGLAPLVTIFLAPSWAEGRAEHFGLAGSYRPDPAELGAFARAAATRYSGQIPDLPRVRYWQAWSEQNLFYLLNPQRVNGRPASPSWYRGMLNSFAAAVHSVRPDNVVVSGGLAPFEVFRRDPYRWNVAPLEFMRLMLCMSKKLKPTCRARSHFDVWAHHPYTSGGPNHHAYRPDDVSIGDLPEMKRLLNAAVRAGHVVSRRPVGFWVTEFGWDTRPPDPKGVPSREHARWVSEALYRMWQSGISLVTWQMLRDTPFKPGSWFQSGLYYRGVTPKRDRPKPALRAFRFPFVALPETRGVAVWGRTPTSTPGSVILERSFSGRWARVRTVRANRHGIFTIHLPLRAGGYMRARMATNGERSLPFAVRKTRDRFISPFGTVPGWRPRRP
jgi:hypothetical protein